MRKIGTCNAFEFPLMVKAWASSACSAKGLVKAKEFLKVLNKANPEIGEELARLEAAVLVHKTKLTWSWSFWPM